MRTQPMYMELSVWVDQPDTPYQREDLDKAIGRGWRVFATHAIIDSSNDVSVIYVLVQDVELEYDDEGWHHRVR